MTVCSLLFSGNPPAIAVCGEQCLGIDLKDNPGLFCEMFSVSDVWGWGNILSGKEAATLDALTDVTFAVLLTTIGARIKEGQYGRSNQESVIEGFWAVLETEDIPGRKFSPCCELQGGRGICNRGA